MSDSQRPKYRYKKVKPVGAPKIISPSRQAPPKFQWEKEERVLTQAERIIERFGGVANLVAALENAGRKKAASTVYRWTYSVEEGGTGGMIPVASMHDVLLAARVEGIHLTNEDLDARVAVKTKKWLTGIYKKDGTLVPHITHQMKKHGRPR